MEKEGRRLDPAMFDRVMGFVGRVGEPGPSSGDSLPGHSTSSGTCSSQDVGKRGWLDGSWNKQLLDEKALLDMEEYGVSVIDHLMGPEKTGVLCCKVRDHGASQLRQAGVGATVRWEDTNFRGDKIAWISETWDKENTMFVHLFHRLKQVGRELDQRFRKHFSFHPRVSIQLAMYPGEGEGGYVKHSDVGPNCKEGDEQRLFTALYYLNPGWEPKHGGELEIWAQKDRHIALAPIADRLVVFQSRLEHLVRPSHKVPRWAITCWFYGTVRFPLYKPVKGKRVSDNSIFVAIPSYRDSQCQFTIADLFQKAGKPENVFVGVCFQGNLMEDVQSCFNRWDELVPKPDQVRLLMLPEVKARGPTVARRLIHDQLYNDETYILNIDSHMRFQQNWDVDLISMLEKAIRDAEHNKVILSTYPSGYELADNNDHVILPDPFKISLVGPPALEPKHFDENDHLLRIIGKRLDSPIDRPRQSKFWAAGYNFGYAQPMLTEVPYSSIDHLFFGEESIMSVRLWTHGFDFFTPNKEVVFHLWSRSYRPVFQGDEELKNVAMAKIVRVLSGEREDDAALQLGRERTVHEYEAFTGIDFKNLTYVT